MQGLKANEEKADLLVDLCQNPNKISQSRHPKARRSFAQHTRNP